jgi:MerR family transcriptional regulator, copper efflux regulator
MKTPGLTTPGLTIGRVATQSGVPTKTIRYYEEIQLIPPATRAANGYRLYDQRAVEELRFIRRARDLGFSIEEVEALLALWRDRGRTSGEVKRVALQHVARVEQKIAELESLRKTLLELTERCHGDDRPDCPIIDDLVEGPRGSR